MKERTHVLLHAHCCCCLKPAEASAMQQAYTAFSRSPPLPLRMMDFHYYTTPKQPREKRARARTPHHIAAARATCRCFRAEGDLSEEQGGPLTAFGGSEIGSVRRSTCTASLSRLLRIGDPISSIPRGPVRQERRTRRTSKGRDSCLSSNAPIYGEHRLRESCPLPA
ncbi:hypothetical protein HPB51_011788 [Rhipicephalus microplus]|uniref:Uncharacterized protein n=1 Tax=Rhipicephalus microplus TaxID=6941 RepID=A0A9J6DGA8_RHIMP|nr:hypothetical protein HPB51_011788 [Rhipicephalus microplus]